MRVTSEIVAKDLSRFAEEAEGFSGADLASLAREAVTLGIWLQGPLP